MSAEGPSASQRLDRGPSFPFQLTDGFTQYEHYATGGLRSFYSLMAVKPRNRGYIATGDEIFSCSQGADRI
jgi:hypothetical protein